MNYYMTLIILQGRTHICKIHARSMSVEKDIRYELLARLCPNSTGMYSHYYVYIYGVINNVKRSGMCSCFG